MMSLYDIGIILAPPSFRAGSATGCVTGLHLDLDRSTSVENACVVSLHWAII